MNLKNHGPVFVPFEFQPEIERLSKAALMDLVWDFASTSTGSTAPDEILQCLRSRVRIILAYRSQKEET